MEHAQRHIYLGPRTQHFLTWFYHREYFWTRRQPIHIQRRHVFLFFPRPGLKFHPNLHPNLCHSWTWSTSYRDLWARHILSLWHSCYWKCWDWSLHSARGHRFWYNCQYVSSRWDESVELHIGYCMCMVWFAVSCVPPCENGACVADDVCSCSLGFEGARCSESIFTECAVNPCENEGSCRVRARSFICSCPLGFCGLQCQMEGK